MERNREGGKFKASRQLTELTKALYGLGRVSWFVGGEVLYVLWQYVYVYAAIRGIPHSAYCIIDWPESRGARR